MKGGRAFRGTRQVNNRQAKKKEQGGPKGRSSREGGRKAASQGGGEGKLRFPGREKGDRCVKRDIETKKASASG